MKEFILPLLLVPPVLSVTTVEDAEGWWQHAQKNGVGFVFFLLFLCILGFSARRERFAEKAREKRELDANAERLAMQTEIRDLNKAQLDQHAAHSLRLEQLVKDQTKGMNDNAAEMRNLTRKMKRPCVMPLTDE